MLLPRPFSKILAVFRGGVSPVLIFLSILLGFWFGLVPGWSGFHVVIVALVFVLNVNLCLFLLTAAVAKGLCYAAAPDTPPTDIPLFMGLRRRLLQTPPPAQKPRWGRAELRAMDEPKLD